MKRRAWRGFPGGSVCRWPHRLHLSSFILTGMSRYRNISSNTAGAGVLHHRKRDIDRVHQDFRADGLLSPALRGLAFDEAHQPILLEFL